jgi:hypothetical protein
MITGMTRDEWIAAFAEKLGVVPPDQETVDRLLALAGAAAHRSERTSAPIACFLVGMAGVDPVTAGEMAATIGTPDS